VASRRQWSDLTSGQRVGAVVLGAVEVVLTTVAARDLRRRRADEVRGPRLLWWAGLLVQPIGPIAYLVVGRRPPSTVEE
jgi:hypothetical protein